MGLSVPCGSKALHESLERLFTLLSIDMPSGFLLKNCLFTFKCLISLELIGCVDWKKEPDISFLVARQSSAEWSSLSYWVGRSQNPIYLGPCLDPVGPDAFTWPPWHSHILGWQAGFPRGRLGAGWLPGLFVMHTELVSWAGPQQVSLLLFPGIVACVQTVSQHPSGARSRAPSSRKPSIDSTKISADVLPPCSQILPLAWRCLGS